MKNLLIGMAIALSMSTITNIDEHKECNPPINCTVAERLEDRILCRLDYYSGLLVELAPTYIWGGYWGILGGDCSGQTYWICKMSGLPVNRTTSLRMWQDEGGWPGERVLAIADAHDRAKFGNLGFFDFSKKRPRGHVVFIVLNAMGQDGKQRILFREASFSKKIFKETIMKSGDYRWVRLHGILQLDLTPGF